MEIYFSFDNFLLIWKQKKKANIFYKYKTCLIFVKYINFIFIILGFTQLFIFLQKIILQKFEQKFENHALCFLISTVQNIH